MKYIRSLPRAVAVLFFLSFCFAYAFEATVMQTLYQDNPQAGDFFGQALAYGDFNNDGFDDLAVGCPARTVLGDAEAGSVTVFFGSRQQLGTPTTITAETLGFNGAEPDDKFGYSLAVGDFNGDEYDDLAIGIPEEDLGSTVDAGSLAIIPGSATGFDYTADTIITPNDAFVPATTEADDFFAFSLAAGDFNGDGFDDLAVGCPKEDIGLNSDAGEVYILYGSPAGLSDDVRSAHLFHQDVNGVPDACETGDQFGYALASGHLNSDIYEDLLIGIPFENVSSVSDGGAVLACAGSASGLSTNNMTYMDRASGFAQGPTNKGYFGRSLALGLNEGMASGHVLISDPGRDDSLAQNCGTCYYFRGATNGISPFSYGARTLRPARTESAGAFPVVLADVNLDGTLDMLFGSSGYPVNTYTNAGVVAIFAGNAQGGFDTTHELLSPYEQQMPGNSQHNAQFGYALVVGDFNGDARPDIAVSIPGYTVTGQVAAGAVSVFYTPSQQGLQGPLLLLLN